MNYIGSKQKLAPWIEEIVKNFYKKDLSDAVFADIFAGTGQVARHFKSNVKKVITNDLETYSYVLNKHYIGNTFKMEKPIFENKEVNGVITKNFTEQANIPRKYFTLENAQKIDGLRLEIETQYLNKKISENQYYWALASLIEAADAVANTASVYGAFLKEYKKTALKPLSFKLVPYSETEQKNEIYQMNANDLVKKISGDILYLDPPYNERQYGANYHVLNKILENKEFESDKKTGITEYNKSNYCKKDKVYDDFEDLIKNSNFEFIFISYNNEGLIKEEDFKNILKKYGQYSLAQKEYKRFKADANRPNQAKNTFEHLHILIKK